MSRAVVLMVLLIGLAGAVQITLSVRGSHVPTPAVQAVTRATDLVPVGDARDVAAATLDLAALLGRGPEFQRLHAQIKPARSEARWKQIPWMTSVWKARQQAAAEGKPVLMWCMDGSPLGST